MYVICMVLLPIFVTVFFTSLMESGQPQEMPIGIVDNDNTSTTRALIRRLDAMQTSHVVAHYPTVMEARKAMQDNEIYAFMYFPEGTTSKLLSSRRPKISFYYSQTSLTAGSLLYRDMKTVATLGSAAVGQATMRAKGFTDAQIQTFLQPIALDVHLINNPCVNYNLYLSTMLIPACLTLFILLMTTYSLGMELKRKKGKNLLAMANGNIYVALIGKFFIQTLLFLVLMYAHMFYLFDVLGFEHQGGIGWTLSLGLLTILACQGFAIAVFAVIPSMRMSMSICSLWGVLSFSMVGAAFPLMAMDGPLQSLAWLFPMRHYWLIYALNIFNGFPLYDTWMNFAVLIFFAALPILLGPRVKMILTEFDYMK